MGIIDDLLHDKAGDYIAASVALAQGLMAGDPDDHKVGYTDENGVYAAQTAYGLSEDDRLEVLRLVREEYRAGDITFSHGMFDGTYADGHEEWYVYRWVVDGEGGHWNPIMGPYDTEVDARVAYANKQMEWAL